MQGKSRHRMCFHKTAGLLCLYLHFSVQLMQGKKKGGFCLVSLVIYFIRWSCPPYIPYLKTQGSDGRDPHSPHRCRYVCFWAMGMWNGQWNALSSLCLSRLQVKSGKNKTCFTSWGKIFVASLWILLTGVLCLEKIRILKIWHASFSAAVMSWRC